MPAMSLRGTGRGLVPSTCTVRPSRPETGRGSEAQGWREALSSGQLMEQQGTGKDRVGNGEGTQRQVSPLGLT